MERRTRGKRIPSVAALRLRRRSFAPPPSHTRCPCRSRPPARAVRSLRRRPLAPSSAACAVILCLRRRPLVLPPSRAIPRSTWGAPRFSSGFRSAGPPNNPAWRPKDTPKLNTQPKPAADDDGPAGEASARTTAGTQPKPAADDGGPDPTEASTRAMPARAYLSGCVNWAL